ncbi:hypothetical protein [Stomatohabitans albus]|uniref:hypothetical protein n=1 Tax=Stomatohabitans albus TaxID=3110766 RepID=UPI00300C9A9D
MTEVIIIGIIGTILALLNRTQAVVQVGADQHVVDGPGKTGDDLWQAFEAAMRRDAPTGEPVDDQAGESEEADIRTGMPARDTVISAMEEGSVGFVSTSAILEDDYGNLWLLSNAAVHSVPWRNRIAVSRQPEGWLLQQNAKPAGRLEGEDAVRVVGHFDFR